MSMTIKLFGRFTILSVDTGTTCCCDYDQTYDDGFDTVPRDDEDPLAGEAEHGHFVDCSYCKERLVVMQGILDDDDLVTLRDAHRIVCPEQQEDT